MPIFSHAQAWEEYGIDYAVHKSLWRNCVLATLGPQPDKGTVARDLSGRGNSGTLTGATHLPTWSNQSYRGQSFRAMKLDGSEDKINYGSGSEGAGPFSLACWFCQTATIPAAPPWYGLGGLIVRYHSPFGGAGQYTLRSASNTLNLGGISTSIGGGTIVLNRWHSGIGIALSTSTSAVYLDGVQVASGALTYNANPDVLLIGQDYSTDNARYFPGYIASVFIWRRALTSSEISILARHPLAAYEVRLPKYFFGTLTAVTLTVAGSAVSVTSDSPTLTQHGALTVASSNVVTSSQAPSLTQHNVLSVGNAVCSVTAGSVSLTQHHTLSVDGSALATASGAPNLTQHSVLTVGGAACSVTSQSPALTQHNALTVGNASVGLTSQQPTLTQHSALTIGSSICVVSSGTVALTQHGALTVQSATCTVVSENVVLTDHAPAVVTLIVQGSTCVISSTSPVLTQHGTLIVASSQCLVSSGNVTLAYHAAGAALILEHQTLLLAI